jgi:prepilin-type N-terminal cleavage/methylation domain-containing protein
MHRKDSGFTIVELVVVIILLGILAATALPRFINIDTEAHEAAFAGVQGSLQTGVSMFHAQWVAQGQPAADAQFGDFNDLRTNAEGFPYGLVDNGPGGDVSDEVDCAAVFTNVLQAGAPSVAGSADVPGVAAAGANVDFVAVSTAPPVCTYYHTGRSTASGDTIGTLTYDPANGSVLASEHTF